MTNKKTNKTKAVTETRSFWERNEASNGILLTETIKKYAISIFRGILLFGMCFMIIQPLLNKMALGFMSERDLYDTTIILVPKHFSISNWKIAATLLNYRTTMFNTFWVSVLVSVIQVSVCSLVGYGFSRFNFPLKRFWFFCVILVICCRQKHQPPRRFRQIQVYSRFLRPSRVFLPGHHRPERNRGHLC